MPKNDAPAYNNQELVASAELLAAYNPLDMYVEDESLVMLYAHLVRQLAPERAKDFLPIALTNRNAVIAKAKEFETEQSVRPRLFLVDGDADYILGATPLAVKDLYRLSCYSIENLLAEPASYYSVLSLSHGRKSAHDFETDPLITALNQILEARIAPLAILLAIAHREGVGGLTMTRRLAGLIDIQPGSAKLRPKLYGKLYASTRRAVAAKVGNAALRTEMRAHVARILAAGATPIHLVPGKHSLIPILMMAWHKLDCGSCGPQTLLALLSSHCTYSIDPILRTRILERLAA